MSRNRKKTKKSAFMLPIPSSQRRLVMDSDRHPSPVNALSRYFPALSGASLRRFCIFATIGVSLLSASSFALNDGLAVTPPMGWNSWNIFGGDINEQKVVGVARTMVSSGLRDAGYTYVNIDDNWMAASRDANGNYVPNAARFPHGMKWLADTVHALGLKIGLYSSNGATTCMGLPGGWGFEMQDAQTFARWGIDFYKYDYCGERTNDNPAWQTYSKMRDALKACGRPIVFSICNWGEENPWLWGDTVGHLWRTTYDIENNWDEVLTILDQQVNLWQYAGPGGWNDPDMLEVGNGMSVSEDRAHFSMWCILAAPLITGNDVRSMSAATGEILMNKEAIAINQDSLGAQGKRIRATSGQELWLKEMQDGSKAVALFNRGTASATLTFTLQEIGFQSSGTITVRDVWKKADKIMTSGTYSTVVGSHDVALLRITKNSSTGSVTLIKRIHSSSPTNFSSIGFRGGRTRIAGSTQFYDMSGRNITTNPKARALDGLVIEMHRRSSQPKGENP